VLFEWLMDELSNLSPLHQDPAKVFKGKKMPGRMGNVYDTVHGLKVHWWECTKCLFIYSSHNCKAQLLYH